MTVVLKVAKTGKCMAVQSVSEKVAKKVVPMVAKWADVKVLWKAACLVGWRVDS